MEQDDIIKMMELFEQGRKTAVLESRRKINREIRRKKLDQIKNNDMKND